MGQAAQRKRVAGVPTNQPTPPKPEQPLAAKKAKFPARLISKLVAFGLQTSPGQERINEWLEGQIESKTITSPKVGEGETLQFNYDTTDGVFWLAVLPKPS